MAGRRKKPTPDENQAALAAAQAIAGDAPRQKNPAAVALGRLGGQKGGRARAESLSKLRRSEIAKKAAAARWRGGRKKNHESDPSA